MKKADFIPLIKRALQEDLGSLGDVTSRAIFIKESGRAVLLSKDSGILAGALVFTEVFRRVDPKIQVSFSFQDGDHIAPGDRVALLSGRVRSILQAERTALNFLSLLSGIATRTNTFVNAALEKGKACILDTRKTIPGYRALSKYAVRAGGGTNHRMGLYDMVLIKDNHIDAAGGITKAVRKVRDQWGDRFKVEVECRTVEDVQEALGCGVDVIMLDNMSYDQIASAVHAVAIHAAEGRVKIEASGQMDLENIRQISNSGIDYISVGKLTKSVDAFDFSLDIEL
jgi:nicotinate-nucleotide pyrophosphorylase (carboxylating)